MQVSRLQPHALTTASCTCWGQAGLWFLEGNIGEQGGEGIDACGANTAPLL